MPDPKCATCWHAKRTHRGAAGACVGMQSGPYVRTGKPCGCKAFVEAAKVV